MPLRMDGSLLRWLRTASLAALAASLGSCTGELSLRDAGSRGELLRNNLGVAEAALAAGQPAVARRLYLSLSDRFDEAPEPQLGLGYIAFDSGDYTAAERFFVRAAERAGDARAMEAEALLGAGRTALAIGNFDAARRHFDHARDAGRGLRLETWAANGLAVVATLDGEYETAEAGFGEALRLSSGHPRISANLLRMLIAAGMVESAAEIHAQHDPSFWLDGDGDALLRLIEEARRSGRGPAAPGRTGSRLLMRLSASGTDTVTVERFQPPAPDGLLLRVGRATAASAMTVGKESGEKPGPAPGTERSPIASERGETGSSRRRYPGTLTLTLGQGRRLWLRGDATSVLVASPEIADVQLLSPEALYVIGKAVGRTSVAVLGEEGRVHDWIVSVVIDIEPLREILAKEPELSGVRARRVARGIALTGEVASAALAERALRLAAGALPKDVPVENELRVAGAQQVNLEVQIAEVQRSLAEDLGINWEAFGTSGANLFGFRIGRLASSAPAAAIGIGTFPPAQFGGQVSPGFFFGRRTGTTNIAGMIDALARAGSASVLAKPNITAVSGEAASFFSGGEYPLPTGFDDGVIVFEYKKYGVLLDFVPTVIDSGRIVLKVRPEVSEPSENQAVQVVGVKIPVINVRRAETTVEVGNGESIVIAGLFRNASNTREAGLSGLKDIPGLGALFGTRSTRSEELELIVIVTARLVTANPSPAGAEEPPALRVGGYHY